MSTTISYDDYLKALGLFTLAKEHSDKSDVFRKALGRLLAPDKELDHLCDAIYSNMRGFDEALKLEGFIVEPEPLAARDQGSEPR